MRTRYTVDMILEIYRRNKTGESLRDISKSLELHGKKALENILYRLDRTIANPNDRYATDVMKEVARSLRQNGQTATRKASSNLSRLEDAMKHLQDTIVDFVIQEVEVRTREEKSKMATILETAKKTNWLNKLSDKFSTELEQ